MFVRFVVQFSVTTVILHAARTQPTLSHTLHLKYQVIFYKLWIWNQGCHYLLYS